MDEDGIPITNSIWERTSDGHIFQVYSVPENKWVFYGYLSSRQPRLYRLSLEEWNAVDDYNRPMYKLHGILIRPTHHTSQG